MSNGVKLADNCNIYNVNSNEVRFRKGIWNYEEAILTMNSLEDDFRDIVKEFLLDLDNGETVDVNEVLNKLDTEETKELFLGFVENLKTQKFLKGEDEGVINNLLSMLIGGTFAYRYTQYDITALRPVLLVTDSVSTATYCEMMAKDIRLPITVMTAEDIAKYESFDLTTRFEGLKTSNQINEMSRELEMYSSIVVVLSTPKITLLRNLNRVAVKDSKMISYAILDGPFLSAFTIKPSETGCFECFENRILARLEDLSAYNAFATKHFKIKMTEESNTYITPLLNTFASLPIFEAFLYACTGKAKLSNRVLNVFLPSLEVQVQDLLRIPSCPACGFISQSQMEDMYTSSTRLVENLVNNILIKE